MDNLSSTMENGMLSVFVFILTYKAAPLEKETSEYADILRRGLFNLLFPCWRTEFVLT